MKSRHAEAEIPEYWVVNLKNQTLIIFREPRSGQYTSRQEYTSDNITPLAFLNISIPISAIIE